ncbi:MAG: response regulator transcription factor [Bacteroidota bacterium]
MDNGKKVLIVEDEPIISADLAAYVKRMGHQVIGRAFNSEKALDLIANQQPDLVLLDINIEGTRDGIEIAQVIRQNYHLPFIFITSYSDKDTLKKAKVTMPYGYIVKPFHERDIISTIEMALFRAESEQGPSKLNKVKVDRLCISPLTRKEFEILEDVVKGMSNSKLAEKHFLSINTIKTHMKNLFIKLEVSNRPAAIAKVSG